MEVSAIITFRALNFLIEYFGLKWNSESLTIMSGEMEPCVGQPSGDPAFAAIWKQMWGEQPLRTEEDARVLAVVFLEREGGWAEGDDSHERLGEGLKSVSREPDGEIALAWSYCLDKARRYSDRWAWSLDNVQSD